MAAYFFALAPLTLDMSKVDNLSATLHDGEVLHSGRMQVQASLAGNIRNPYEDSLRVGFVIPNKDK
jgi:hypothetical protein